MCLFVFYEKIHFKLYLYNNETIITFFTFAGIRIYDGF
jgi:hypothetical protein